MIHPALSDKLALAVNGFPIAMLNVRSSEWNCAGLKSMVSPIEIPT
jgi:hypothetical protein